MCMMAGSSWRPWGFLMWVGLLRARAAHAERPHGFMASRMTPRALIQAAAPGLQEAIAMLSCWQGSHLRAGHARPLLLVWQRTCLAPLAAPPRMRAWRWHSAKPLRFKVCTMARVVCGGWGGGANVSLMLFACSWATGAGGVKLTRQTLQAECRHACSGGSPQAHCVRSATMSAWLR